MNLRRWYLQLGFALIIISVILYLLQIIIFNKIEDTLFYLMQDCAFVPFQVLLVMLIIDRLLKKKEKETFKNKLNMVIGVFYHEMGREILSMLSCFLKNRELLLNELKTATQWDERTFNISLKNIKSFPYEIEIDVEDLNTLKVFLLQNQKEMLYLLENPNLLEHDSFTDMLWSVFHVSDELSNRQKLNDLPERDIDHLKGDISRAFRNILIEWISYMRHLKSSYPFLYSIAVRTDPFNPDATVVIS